jgi:photosystem II stability/assembly factor-like uncharacterized protein
MPETYYTDTMGMLWVQPDGPNTQCYPLFCHDMGDLDAPMGDVTTSLCLNANRQWETVNRDQGAPSAATTTIEAWLPNTRTWLQRQLERRCPLTFYVQRSECPPDDVFLNYDVGKVLQNSIITSHGESNMVLRRGDEGASATKSSESFDVNAQPNPPLYWKLEHARRSIVEDEHLRDIAFCTVPRCAGACGPAADVCDSGVIVADAATGVAADVWYTANSAQTWTSLASPFPVNADLATVVCFPLDRNTTRVVIGVGTTGAGQVAYSDNLWSGAGTWSALITMGVAAEFFMHSGGLFALDQYHVWGGTDLGTIYFSVDGAATWTAQAPVNATPDAIYYIHFIDYNYGWAVGDNRWMNYTTDGGGHWSLITNAAGTATDIYTCVATIDRNRAWVGGTNIGKTAAVFYYTADAGATWTNRLPRLTAATAGGTITTIGDVMFYDEFAGAVVGNWNDGSHDYKGTWRTYNGGYDWEFYYDTVEYIGSALTQFGGEATWICDYNHIVSVGEVGTATGLIEDLTAAGSV